MTPPVVHGLNGYTNWRCRCEVCKMANRTYRAEYRRRRRQRPIPDDAHGTFTTYLESGCRCRPCTDAATAYRREWLRRKRLASPLPDPG